MAVNTAVYNITGQTAQAYKNPTINLDAPKENRFDQLRRYKNQQKNELSRRSVDNFVLTKINDLPEDWSAQKLPPQVKASVQPVVMSARQNYATYARQIAQMQQNNQSGTPEYFKVLDLMNAQKNQLDVVNNSLKELQELTNEYVDNRENMSKGMPVKRVAALDSIFVNNNYKYVVTPEGPMYQTPHGTLRQEDISKYFLKDSSFTTEILKQAQTMYSNGIKGVSLAGNESAQRLLRFQFENALDKGGEETLLSLMNDEIFDGFKLANIPPEIANDPSRHGEAKSMILDGIMDHLLNVNKDGYSQYSAKQKVTGTGTGASIDPATGKPYKYGQSTRDDLQTWYNQGEGQDFIDKLNNISNNVLNSKDPEMATSQVLELITSEMDYKDKDKIITQNDLYDKFLSNYTYIKEGNWFVGDKEVTEAVEPTEERFNEFIEEFGNYPFYYDTGQGFNKGGGIDVDMTDPSSILDAYLRLGGATPEARKSIVNNIRQSMSTNQSSTGGSYDNLGQ